MTPQSTSPQTQDREPEPPAALNSVRAITPTVHIDDDNWNARVERPELLLLKACNAVAGHMSPELESDCEVAFVLTDDERQSVFNSEFRGKSGTTNVLSFPADDAPEFAMEPESSRELGDITIAREVVFAEAESMSVPIADHVTHLAVHGLLHLLGYDHETEQDAEQMEAIEIDILAKLNIPNPYQQPHSRQVSRSE